VWHIIGCDFSSHDVEPRCTSGTLVYRRWIGIVTWRRVRDCCGYRSGALGERSRLCGMSASWTASHESGSSAATVNLMPRGAGADAVNRTRRDYASVVSQFSGGSPAPRRNRGVSRHQRFTLAAEDPESARILSMARGKISCRLFAGMMQLTEPQQWIVANRLRFEPSILCQP
jgi:hypothetical protein